jgi:hypothetical protein
MSRDLWSKQLRIAGADPRAVEEVLAADAPADGLQHAGSALLRVERSDVLVASARRLIEALGQRGWVGDAELIVELEHYVRRQRLLYRPDRRNVVAGATVRCRSGPCRLRPRVGSVAARGRPRVRPCIRRDAAIRRDDRATGSRIASQRCACGVWCIPPVPDRTQPARGRVHTLAPVP